MKRQYKNKVKLPKGVDGREEKGNDDKKSYNVKILTTGDRKVK
jgi:hypothetical protein